MSEVCALGVFRVPVEPEQVVKFGRILREFSDRVREEFGDFDSFVYIARPDENEEVALLNSVVGILTRMEELEGPEEVVADE